MKRTSLLLLSSALLSCGILFAQTPSKAPVISQRTCGVMSHEAQLELANPQRAAQRQAYEQQTQNYITSTQNLPTVQAAINIPVVVHVVYNTAAQNIPTNQVLSQIQVLNEDFTLTNADASSIPAAFQSVAGNFDINFCLAQTDPNGNPTTGIERRSTTVTSFVDDDAVKFFSSGGLNAWDPSRYFNIWVCPLGGGLLGYAEFPTATLSNTYGIVILYNAFGSNFTSYGTFAAINTVYNRGRTVTHEIGHCFNLRHIWGDDGTACTGSDLCADTPNQSSENYGCPAFPHTDACTPSGNGVMFMNYMDYVDDPCMYMFTNNQKTRAQAVVNTAPYNALQTSTACQSPVNAPPVAMFTMSSSAVCPSTPINFTDQSSTNTTGWTWTFPSGSPATSTAQNPSGITWSTPGTYTVTLVASNANGTSTYTLTVNVLGVITPPLTEGFEATTFVPANWSQYDAGNDGAVWLRYNAGRNSSYSAKFDNFNNNVNGNRDELRAPRMNFSSAATITLTFDVAHRRYSTNNANNDSLEVAVSTNCGATWTSVYLKGGATLASVTGTTTNAFTPTNTQWRNETVSLNAYAGQGSVMICFRNRGHYGNNIYIDNVNITTTAAAPVATFTASATTVCRGTPVSFTDASTGSPTSWTWTFPSGTPGTATTQNVASVVWNTAGTYTVTHTATNANGTGTTTQVITVNALPTITTTTTGVTICNGSSTTITGSGGTSYSWMPGNLTGTTVTVSPTTTTTYTVTGTNANGCTNTATRTITVNPSPTITTTTTNATICSGSSTSMTASGGTTYNWMPGNLTGATVTVSPATTTTYTVTGTGSNGCTSTATRTITVNPSPTVTTTTTGATICNGSSTTITGNGATTYTWMPGNLTGTTVMVSPTTTTTYTVTGTSSGCTGTATRTITVNPSPTITTTTTGATICSGSSTTITGSGGTSYSWMPGNLTGTTVTVSPTTTTTYTVTGTAANGCTNTATRTITVNPSPTVTTTTTNATICNGSSTTITGSGATTYAWMPGNLTGTTITVSPTTTTTYTVTGTSSGCTGTATRMITVNPTPTITTTTTGATICNGSSTTITGNGGTTYMWMPGNLTGTTVTVSPTSTTTYTVTGTDGNGCTNTATRTITVNPLPTITTTTTGATICSGNSTTITGSGGTSYNWMPGNLAGTTVTVSPTTTTTYTVTGTGANGCTNTATRTITVNPTPTLTATASSSSICTGNTVTLTATGATTYNWMPGNVNGASITRTPTATTTYTVTGTSSGCTGTATVTVIVGAPPTVTATASSPAICNGSSTTLTGVGATTYTWMPGNLSGTSITVNPTATTTYTVTGSTGPGCVNTATLTVTVNALPNVTTTTSGGTICSGNSTNITANGAATYSWMPGNLTGTMITDAPATTTTYTVTGTDGNGCTNTATQLITVNPTPTVTATISNTTICNGTTVTLTANGSTTYSWMPGNLSGASVTDIPSSSTTYTVTGTESTGCSATATVAITVNPNPSVVATISTNTVCAGTSVTLTGNGATTYDWQPVNLQTATATDIPAASVTYTLTGTDANGCSATDMVSVTVNALPLVDATSSNSGICTGSSVTLNASGAATYSWMPVNQTSSTVSDAPAVTTTYTLTGTDANGCVNTDTTTVAVYALPTISVSGNTLVCPGDSATLTASGATTYTWQPGGQTTTVITDAPATSTTYTVTGTDGSGCTASTTYTVMVDTPPATPSITINGTLLTSTVTGASYQWFLNGVPLAGETNQTHVVTQTGAYTVIVYNANGCPSAESAPVNDPLGIGTVSNIDFIIVTPNPNDGHFMLSFNAAQADNYVLEIHDVLGQVVYSETLLNFSGKFSKEIDLNAFGKGMYSISISSADHKSVIRTITY